MNGSPFCLLYYNCHNFECVETEVPLKHPRRASKLAAMYRLWYLLALGGGVLGSSLNDLGVIHWHNEVTLGQGRVNESGWPSPELYFLKWSIDR